MENECKMYLSTGPLNFIIVVLSDRRGPGPLVPPSESAPGVGVCVRCNILVLPNNFQSSYSLFTTFCPYILCSVASQPSNPDSIPGMVREFNLCLEL